MIASQARLGHILKLLIVGHFLCRQMAVIIINRHFGRMVVIKLFGRFSQLNNIG
jgi:hypothetical protein